MVEAYQGSALLPPCKEPRAPDAAMFSGMELSSPFCERKLSLNYLLSCPRFSRVAFSVPVGLGITIHGYLWCSGMMSSDAPPCHYQPLCVMELE